MESKSTNEDNMNCLWDRGDSNLSEASLKENFTHYTCQIYVKAHFKKAQMSLKWKIYDEKATK